MQINNFAIDRIIRGMMYSTADDSYMWSINQITDPSLNITSETAQAVDALGSPIATFNRGKTAEFTANNSLFDLGLFAAQNGTEVKRATAVKPITTPKFEEIKYVAGTSVYTLSAVPVDAPETLYLLNGDGTLGQSYGSALEPSATKFVYDDVNNQITVPTSAEEGNIFFLYYEYEMQSGSSVSGTAVEFPKAGRFIMEVLGVDVCDPTTLIHAFLIFPNAKLDANVDLSFTTDGNHPFTIQCQQSYCDPEKKLFDLIIPDITD